MKRISATAAVAAIAVLFVPWAAQAGSATDRATGGGQVLIGTRGAGDTVAFTAQGTAESAEGQVQYVDRADGTGQGQTVHHGTVSCLRVEGRAAKLAGTWDGGGTYQLHVVDNGEGATCRRRHLTVQNVQDPTCDEEDDDDDGQTALARGNAQVYDAP